MNSALGVVDVARVVGDHADGGAALMDVAEEIHDRVAIFGVEVSGGLIGKENHGVANESACDGDALLLTAGELGRVMLGAVGHFDAFEGALDFFLPFGGGHAAIREGQFDVFINSKVADQVERLKNKADFTIANSGSFRGGDL